MLNKKKAHKKVSCHPQMRGHVCELSSYIDTVVKTKGRLNWCIYVEELKQYVRDWRFRSGPPFDNTHTLSLTKILWFVS